jgi:5'-methylthioadenosine phosphorylase
VAKLKIGIIGGSGLGQALLGSQGGTPQAVSTPFGRPSSPILQTRWEGVELALLSRHGQQHVFNPSSVPYRANIYALKSLGVTHIIASGAVGSLQADIEPRHLVIPDQIIDKTSRRASTFFDAGVVAHVEFADPFCPTLRAILLSAARSCPTKVHEKGTYVCMEGPQFSTRAESLLHRGWGADLIGMTVVPEAKLAREAEICYALVALATDYDCWRPHEPRAASASSGRAAKQELLAEIIGNLNAATDNAMQLIRAAVRSLAQNPPGPCACQNALELAIWTDKAHIDRSAIEPLAPLLNKYLP